LVCRPPQGARSGAGPQGHRGDGVRPDRAPHAGDVLRHGGVFLGRRRRTPTKAQISEIYVDSTNIARVTWSKAATITTGATQATLATSSRNPGDTITIPSTLLVKQTYLILSEVSYLYTPTIGYVMAKAGVTLTDSAYTRPRQSTCIYYNNLPATVPCPMN
jgi:hypothetical protein